MRQKANALKAAGYQVTVICPNPGQQPRREMVDGVRVYRFSAPPHRNSLWGYLWEYGHALTAMFGLSLLVLFQGGFDVIHAYGPPDILVFIAAFYKLFGKRFVFDHHDLSPELYQARFGGNDNNRLVYRALVMLEKFSCKLADHVIATNQSYQKVQMERGHVPEERITIVRLGPDLNRLRPVDPDPSLRCKGKTIIGYVGVTGVQDGVDYLIRALHHLIHDLDRTDFYCIIIGRGDAWFYLKDLTAQLDLNEYVSFPGVITDDAELSRYLSTVDICVEPAPLNSYTDRSTMVKLIEYMAFGKPIVAFDLTEHRVIAQDSALYAYPNAELDFARQLVLLMDDPERRQKMGQIARKRVETELAWSLQSRNLIEAYETLGWPG